MKTTTTIDAAGRLVIPKRFRERYGLSPGETVRFVAGDAGVTIVPRHSVRRFVQRGPLLAIETGAAEAPIEAFDVRPVRDRQLESKAHADRS